MTEKVTDCVGALKCGGRLIVAFDDLLQEGIVVNGYALNLSVYALFGVVYSDRVLTRAENELAKKI